MSFCLKSNMLTKEKFDMCDLIFLVFTNNISVFTMVFFMVCEIVFIRESFPTPLANI